MLYPICEKLMIANKPQDVWKKIQKGHFNECWLWTGSVFGHGYGRFCIGMQSRTAHKFVYELVNGKVENGLYVMHKCNNKLCCNPDHLKLGTPLENTQHASTSGMFKPGLSKIRGVGYIKDRGYWHSQGWLKGKRINLYTGPDKNKAISARKRWEQDHRVTFNINKGV